MSNAERKLLKKVYPDKKWAEKVDKMSNAEVTAVLTRLERQHALGDKQK